MKFGMGQSVKRKEDSRFLTGTGRYTDDVNLEGQLYAYVLRSPVAAGRIRSLDIEAAKSAPGVAAVFVHDDVAADGIGPLHCLVPVKNVDGTSRADPPRPALAKDRVRFVGDPVALVVANSPDEAKDAAELIDLDIEELPSCTDPTVAASAGQPPVWDEHPGNICFTYGRGDKAKTDAAFSQAKHVVPFRVVNNRVVVNPLEPRAVIGDYEPDKDRLVLYTSSQGVNNLRRALLRALNVPEEKFRVVTPDVGGGFGMKIFAYPEQILCLFAARRLKRPVKWTGDRSESFLSDTQGRDNVTEGEIALNEDGTFAGLRIRTTADLGAYLSTFGAFIPTAAGTRVLGGVYHFPAMYTEVTGVFTNTVPIDAYRGAGRPENIYQTERAIDIAAAKLGLDPVELRRKNFIKPEQLPYRTAMGETIDSGAFSQTMDRALAAADVAGFPARRSAAEKKGKLRGLGITYYMEATAGAPTERSEIRFNEDGGVTVIVGTQSNGQGHETSYAQVVSEKLGIDFEKIRVVMGDTDVVVDGFGTGGSRSLIAEGSALLDATGKIIEKGKRVASQALETAVEDIEFTDGAFRIAGTDRSMTLFDVAQAAREGGNLPEGEEPGLDQVGNFQGDCTTFPNGCHICEVEIDPDTGVSAVVNYTVAEDMGRLVNPMLVTGQIHGGIAQGVGQAIYEHCIYDHESGQLMTGSFMDYCMPRAHDMPDIQVVFNEEAPTSNNVLGVKGAGEAGAVGAPPVVISALCNALQAYGVQHLDMPATAEKIWRLIHGTGAAAAE